MLRVQSDFQCSDRFLLFLSLCDAAGSQRGMLGCRRGLTMVYVVRDWRVSGCWCFHTCARPTISVSSAAALIRTDMQLEIAKSADRAASSRGWRDCSNSTSIAAGRVPIDILSQLTSFPFSLVDWQPFHRPIPRPRSRLILPPLLRRLLLPPIDLMLVSTSLWAFEWRASSRRWRLGHVAGKLRRWNSICLGRQSTVGFLLFFFRADKFGEGRDIEVHLSTWPLGVYKSTSCQSFPSSSDG